MLQGAYGKEDVEKYVKHFFVISAIKNSSKAEKLKAGKCCDGCMQKLLGKAKTGIQLSQLDMFLTNLKQLVEKHASTCASQNVRVSKSKTDDEECAAFNMKITFLCLDCKKSGSFLVQEIRDARLSGDLNFLEFRCSSFW